MLIMILLWFNWFYPFIQRDLFCFCFPACDGQADVVFVIDASGSIRQSRFQTVLEYVTTVVEQLEVAQDRTRVGVVVYSDDAEVKFQLNTYPSKQDVLSAIRSQRWIQGRTNTAAALNIMTQTMFTPANGDRYDVPNYAIVVTDGESNVQKEQTLPSAIAARLAGIHLMVVTVSEKPNLELKGIASDPDDNNLLYVNRFDLLPTITDTLVSNMCDGVYLTSSFN